KCSNATINKIQKPYTCTFSLPLSPGCRFIFGDVDLQGYDESLDQIEVIYGTLILDGTNMTSFPKLPNLRRLVQNPGKPLLVVENNQQLTDMKALYNTTLDIDDIKNAVRISGNPKLCKTKRRQTRLLSSNISTISTSAVSFSRKAKPKLKTHFDFCADFESKN
ncbi:receptor L domain protein, partial [Oesophagostomum dentatum]